MKRPCASLLLLALGALWGCGELTSGGLRSAEVLGAISYGSVKDGVGYIGGHLAYRFDGRENDVVDAYAQSDNGHALAWIVDSSFGVVGYMQDPSVPTYRAHVQTPLPWSGTYYLVFREASSQPATFQVTLEGVAAPVTAGP
jgi:hypothetical protein